jgi:hypothetical protein
MKMKFLLGLLWATAASAQVNLDQPLTVGVSDHVFKSNVDPKVAYYIPIAINRVGDVQITQPDDDHMQARFTAGVAAENIAEVKSKLPGVDVRFLRPESYTMDPNGATDIGSDFAPVLTPLGDLDLAGPMPYSLRVKKHNHVFGASGAEKLFKQLFGPSGADNVGVIRYQFDAVVAGKPELARSAVAIFVGEKPKPITPMLEDFLTHGTITGDRMDSPASGAEVLQDATANCWDTVLPGQYCVRAQ